MVFWILNDAITAKTPALLAGVFFAYTYYDCIHYYLHHAQSPICFHLEEMKRYHLEHHYKNPTVNYGVTSQVWDYVCGTSM